MEQREKGEQERREGMEQGEKGTKGRRRKRGKDMPKNEEVSQNNLLIVSLCFFIKCTVFIAFDSLPNEGTCFAEGIYCSIKTKKSRTTFRQCYSIHNNSKINC